MSKTFIIRCPKCRWAEMSTGIRDDLKHLKELTPACPTCGGKPRQFRCPRCGQTAKMMRVKGQG